MEPTNHSDGVINSLVGAIVALTAWLWYSMRGQKKTTASVNYIPAHTTEHYEKLSKIAESLNNLTIQFKEEIQSALKNERIRVDGYHVRLGDMEDAVGKLETNMKGVQDVELPALKSWIQGTENKTNSNAERIARIEGARERHHG